MKGVYKDIFSSESRKKISGTTEDAIEIAGRCLAQKNFKQHTVSASAKGIVGW